MNRQLTAMGLGLGLMLGCALERDDAEIARTVERDLNADLTLSDSQIDAASVDGEVTLVGEVATNEARERAEDIAERVEGVVRVRNQLSVAAPTVPPVASPPPASPSPPGDVVPEEGTAGEGEGGTRAPGTEAPEQTEQTPTPQ